MANTLLVPVTGVRRIDELDALRGIVACAVVLYHFTSGLHANIATAHVASWSFAWGEYGVQGFFAISGFVILMTLERTVRASDFVVSRFSRLFPAYWVAMAITLAVVALWGHEIMHRSGETALLNLTMLQSWFGYGNVDPSYWTLGVELGFYALMLGMWRMRMLGEVESIALAYLVFRTAVRVAPSLDAWLNSVTVLQHVPFFFIGLISYRIWQGERTPTQQLPLLLLAGLNLYLSNMPALTAVFSIVTLMMVMLANGKFAGLRHPVLQWLGAISYPLYLVHQFVGCTLIIRLGEAGVPGDVSTLMAIIVVVALAAAINAGIEKPAQRFIRQWWKNRAPTPQFGELR
jgi:peptidoglycan/LPS O-acetylase OafA/YrhL